MCSKLHTLLFLGLLISTIFAEATPKTHVLTFGKWTAVRWMVGPSEGRPIDMKVRPLHVDARLKEYTTGLPHDITDRLFVVQRVFRVNDSLPEDPGGVLTGNGSGAGGFSWTASRGKQPRFRFQNSIRCLPQRSGIAITSPTAESPTTANDFSRLSPRLDIASRFSRRQWATHRERSFPILSVLHRLGNVNLLA